MNINNHRIPLHVYVLDLSLHTSPISRTRNGPIKRPPLSSCILPINAIKCHSKMTSENHISRATGISVQSFSAFVLPSLITMTAGEEAEAPVAEQPLATEEPKVEEKPVKEKKPRTPREKKPRQPKPKTVAHPPYFQMIKEAILALNEKSGSSPYAIAKYMEGKHKAVLPANFKKILGLQLKNSAARGKLIKIRASFKLSEAGKKEKSTTGKVSNGSSAVKKTEEAKPSMRNTRSVNKADASAKKVGAKKAKKSAAAKPKQPKSIKSPSVKRAKKVTATA